MNEEVLFINQTVSVLDYQRLREGVGWSDVLPQAAERGLKNSLYSVCALHKDKIIGYGRVIGDGALYFDLVDIIVLPEYQGKGIGKAIVERLMSYIDSNACQGTLAGLMAAKGVAGFYEKFGFRKRFPESPGMCLIWEGSERR